MTASIYFASLLATAMASLLVALYAFRHRTVSGSGAFARLEFTVFLLAVTEVLSMLGESPSQALFWFRMRYTAAAALAIFWIMFALDYSGLGERITGGMKAGILAVPLLTQALLWTNGFHGLWVRQEAAFHRSGSFWIAETWTRIPAAGFLLHSFYGLALIAAGAGLIFFTAWGRRKSYRVQALLLSSAALVSLALSIIPSFGLIQQTDFNPFTPGMGLCSIIYAVAIFRFRFLKDAPASEEPPGISGIRTRVKGSLPLFILIFIVMGAGIGAGGFVSYRDYEERFRTRVESEITSIARLKLDELTDWHAGRMADAKVFFRNNAFSSLVERLKQLPDDRAARLEAQTWLDSALDKRYYDRISLLDAAGSAIVSSPQDAEPEAPHISDDCKRTLAKDEIFFLDFHRDGHEGPVRLAVFVPIYSRAEGRPLAVLALRIAPDRYLYPFISHWPVPSRSAETLLVRREGDHAVFLNDLRFLPGSALKLKISLEKGDVPAVSAVLGHRGIVEGPDYRGVPVIAYVGPVPGTPWFIIARTDISEALGPLKARLWQTTVFFAVLLTASGALLGLIWRQQALRYYKAQGNAAETVRKSEERLRLALKAARLGLYDLNIQTGEARVNDQYALMLGYDPACFHETNSAWIERLHPDDREPVSETYRHYIAGDIPEYKVEFRQQTGSGDWIWILSVGEVAARDAQGNPTRMLGIHTDITEAKLAQEEIKKLNTELEERVKERTTQLEAANRELEAFSYSVSHDLRAPLRALDGFSAALLSGYREGLDEQGRHYLDRIQAASRRMGQLIDDLLNLSRVSRRDIQKKEVDMSGLAGDITAELKRKEPARKVAVRIHPGMTAYGDAHLIRIAMENLLGNAWKFTGKAQDPLIHVGMTELEGDRTFFVRDNGVGFDMAYADKLFVPFQRLHSMTEFPGTGIGLATVQRIINRHGGTIRFEAEINNGATFFFTLGDSNG